MMDPGVCDMSVPNNNKLEGVISWTSNSENIRTVAVNLR